MKDRRTSTFPIFVGIFAWVLVGVWSAATAFLNAQAGANVPQRAVTKDDTYRSGVELVSLTVTVQEPGGLYVPNLERERFHVFDEGIPQQVAFFGINDVPIDLVLLVDTSASMNDKLATTAKAATNFVRALGPTDRAALMSFGTRTQLRMPFTTDREAIEREINSLRAGDSTALYNSVYIALKEFGKPATPDEDFRRRAIVLLSDGEDTASLMSFDSVLEQARRSDVAVYVIFMQSPNMPKESDMRFSQPGYEMRTLASETGARSFFPMQLAELNGVYGSIASELSQQYALGFVPEPLPQDGRFRRVSVTVDHPNAKVRTRSGYIPATRPRAIAALEGLTDPTH